MPDSKPLTWQDVRAIRERLGALPSPNKDYKDPRLADIVEEMERLQQRMFRLDEKIVEGSIEESQTKTRWAIYSEIAIEGDERGEVLSRGVVELKTGALFSPGSLWPVSFRIDYIVDSIDEAKKLMRRK